MIFVPPVGVEKVYTGSGTLSLGSSSIPPSAEIHEFVTLL